MSLRTKLIEAGARAQVHDFGALESSTQRFYIEVSERVLDAFLDCLVEFADETGASSRSAERQIVEVLRYFA